MKKDRSAKPDVENLLKRVLRDDLPPDTETSMRKRLAELRRAMEQAETPSAASSPALQRPVPAPAPWQWARWIFRKEVLALSSVVMMVLGCVMHLGGYRSVLADSMSLLKLSVTVSDQLRRSTSMDCSIRMPVAGSKTLQYRVRWMLPGKTRVDIQTADGKRKTIWIMGGTVTIADHAGNSLNTTGGVVQRQDALLRPVAAFLSPAELARRVDERWQLKDSAQHKESSMDTVTFADPHDQALVEMTVDPVSFLPMNLRRLLPVSTRAGTETGLLMEAQFVWNQPVVPELMVPHVTAER